MSGTEQDRAPTVRTRREGRVLVVSIDRPEVRNAVDRPTAAALASAFTDFDGDDDLDVAVLTGEGGTFCAGADLGAVAEGRGNRVDADLDMDGPMGPTRMRLSKPVIAAIEGYAVAGGLELAIWCDLRVAARDAALGVFCRRWGVPLVDGGTVRLPRLIGHSRAMDLILTGREVGAEAKQIGPVTVWSSRAGRLRRPWSRGAAQQAAAAVPAGDRRSRSSSGRWTAPRRATGASARGHRSGARVPPLRRRGRAPRPSADET